MTNRPNPPPPDQDSVSAYGVVDWAVELVDTPLAEPCPETVWQENAESVTCPLPSVTVPQVTPLTSTIAVPITMLPEPMLRLLVSLPLADGLVNVEDTPKAVKET
jgi:hypothetical protein